MKKTLSALLILALTLTLCGTAFAANDEIVDGRFVETRHITVEVYDRSNDGGTDPTNNDYTDYIKKGVLEDLNIEVTYVPVPRWTEPEAIANLLAANEAPDVCVTYQYPVILSYANMGAVVDLGLYVDEYADLLPNLWDWLEDINIYWDRDPDTGTIWALEARLANTARINTFVREDWLAKLGLAEPTTLEEFENMLYAFKDNAELLLGADAGKMVPFGISFDVGWRADHLLSSFVPQDLTDKDQYVYGFDDRHLLYPGYKEGVRKLNEWYNAGLIWTDFALYGSGDTTEDNLIKSGYVGAFIHNWDYPYRNAEEGIHYTLKSIAGEDAVYIAVEPFKNDAGLYTKFLSGRVDRKVFFPYTNTEPLASLMYLDWITAPEHRMFLQIGDEGVTHEVTEDGAIKTISAQGTPYIMNSGNNIDYTTTINGLNLGDASLTGRSIALGYAFVDGRFVEKAFTISTHDGRTSKNAACGAIESEEGMGNMLSEKRNTLLCLSITASVADFDKVFDAGMADYLASGGQAIIDERAAAWEKTYGDALWID